MAYSIVIEADGTATAYATKALAQAAYAALTPEQTPALLFLEPAPSKELGLGKVEGTWTDAYGVVRVVGTGAEFVEGGDGEGGGEEGDDGEGEGEG